MSLKQDVYNETTLLLKSGDEATFDIVFKQHYAALYAFASNFIPINECEDVIQETMMWLWENRYSLDSDKSLKSLLFTIVKNKCLNRISHLQIKQQVHSDLYSKFIEQFEDPDFYTHTDLLRTLDQTIKNLPKDYREAFEMNRYHDLTYKEIAEKMGVSTKTVAYRIGQALKILRVELKDYLPIMFLGIF